MKSILRATSLGLEIAVAVFLGAFIGYQIDMRAQSKPWAMVAGVLFGGAAGTWRAIRMALKEK